MACINSGVDRFADKPAGNVARTNITAAEAVRHDQQSPVGILKLTNENGILINAASGSFGFACPCVAADFPS